MHGHSFRVGQSGDSKQYSSSESRRPGGIGTLVFGQTQLFGETLLFALQFLLFGYTIVLHVDSNVKPEY